MSEMVKYRLTKESFDLMKGIDFSEMGDKLRLIEEERAVETSDFQLMQIIINEEIVTKGLDERQENCTLFGRKLYALYDELLDLKYERMAKQE